jgi:hypothetical protein
MRAEGPGITPIRPANSFTPTSSRRATEGQAAKDSTESETTWTAPTLTLPVPSGRTPRTIQSMEEAQLMSTRVTGQIRRKPEVALEAQGQGLAEPRVQQLLEGLIA